jgi:acetoacetate decarboxylase
MSNDTFLERPLTAARTSAGDIELPVLYRDASAVVAFFRVDLRRAAEVLTGTPFTPVRFAGGAGLAAFAAYDYRDTSIGPYREAAAAVAVVPQGLRAPTLALLHLLRERAHEDVGWHVLDLPVTTALADAAGRELYGFPKFTTRIDVELRGGDVRACVQAPVGEDPIVRLEGREGPGVALGAMDLVLYSVREGEILRSVVEARGRMHTGLGRGLVLRVGGADHPMARRLAALGLDGARPIAAQACARYQAVLHAAEPFHGAVRRAA